MTSQEAADLLGVSRPHLAKLLDQGEIPSHKVGTHRRVSRAALISFLAEQRAQRSHALDELVALQESMKIADHAASSRT
jgi:excisionase family DNA binding protein